ncbi:MAG: agmatine deiminase family protein [Deferrisomatales bacterium]|nr:agmatine deiminase family protein [Deferrisomatales bacterium]
MARRLPAEWEPQDGVLLCWPHPDTDWGPRLDWVEPVFTELVRQISRFASVLLVARDEPLVADILHRAGVPRPRVQLYPLPSDDTWARDCGPLTVLDDGSPRLMDFTFNGWGGKYPAQRDDRLTAELHRAGAFGTTPLETPGLVLEGGSVDSDGAGTLLTTTRCLLHPGRNPQLDRAGVEAALGRWLGAERVLWLEHGELQGDDTDAHVDTLARFAPGDTIVYQGCADPADPHFGPLERMAAELAEFRNREGRAYRLLPLPWPKPRFDDDGIRLPATYANFLVVNDAVLLPTYGDPADAPAAEILADAFPGREVVAVPCAPLLEQHGSLHCLTMQIPRGVLP